VHEPRTRPDDEHAAAGEPVAVGVEQVRDPVQRDGGLARPGAALDHDGARQRQTDDLVLLGLDGGDDVAHAGPARRGEGGEERGVRRRHGPGAGPVAVEEVVVEAGDPLVRRGAGDGVVPAPGHTERG
jgi:hypothetical protein